MEENREFPKKQLLSLQLDLSKFEQASEEEKAQALAEACGCTVAESAAEVAEKAQYIVLGVKL